MTLPLPPPPLPLLLRHLPNQSLARVSSEPEPINVFSSSIKEREDGDREDGETRPLFKPLPKKTNKQKTVSEAKPRMLSWEEFEKQAIQLADGLSRCGDSSWRWETVRPNARCGGFLVRSPDLVSFSSSDQKELVPSSEILTDRDPADLGSGTRASRFRVLVEYHVVYSPSYSVPVLYFNFWSEQGDSSPPSFVSSIRSRVPTTDPTVGGLTPHALLSQGEHPILGTPFWFLHPCSTASFMSELLSSSSSDHRNGQYLATWLSWSSPLASLRVDVSKLFST